MKRQRGRRRSGGGGNNNNPNRHFESTGPDVKIRGSAQQVLDKYLQYARDAQTSGDRINAEAYFQHAEHYARILATMQPKQKPQREDAAETPAQEGGEKAAEAKEGEAAPVNEDAAVEAKDTAEEVEPKAEEAPKRRRRSYKKRDEADTQPDAEKAEGDTEDDGVMKTLSRGRKAEAEETSSDAVEPEEPQPAK